MEKKLRTLKDFPDKDCHIILRNRKERFISERDLRQEGINHIKELMKQAKETELGIDKSFINGKINFAINFFNIELKDFKYDKKN